MVKNKNYKVTYTLEKYLEASSKTQAEDMMIDIISNSAEEGDIEVELQE